MPPPSSASAYPTNFTAVNLQTAAGIAEGALRAAIQRNAQATVGTARKRHDGFRAALAHETQSSAGSEERRLPDDLAERHGVGAPRAPRRRLDPLRRPRAGAALGPDEIERIDVSRKGAKALRENSPQRHNGTTKGELL